MDLSSSSKPQFYFFCTNYGCSKDGIGHYTSKIVNELKKNQSLQVEVLTRETHQLSKIGLFLSTRMFKETLKLNKQLRKGNQKGYIVVEYPFVEYNPLFLIGLMFLKRRYKDRFKIVVSLHEYSRTKRLRKLFIKGLVPLSDILLYTKDQDVEPFKSYEIRLKKRKIPANIVPSSHKKIEPFTTINICYFGIINLETKAIENMIEGWNLFCSKTLDNPISFHFIASGWDDRLKKNENIRCHIGLDDMKTSSLLNEMQYMILPLLPKISINNGSLAVGCAHQCVPVGAFDASVFAQDFGLNMEGYSETDFLEAYKQISSMEFTDYKEKAAAAFEYGKTRMPSETAKTYSNLDIT